jgi:hypothetical protein
MKIVHQHVTTNTRTQHGCAENGRKMLTRVKDFFHGFDSRVKRIHFHYSFGKRVSHDCVSNVEKKNELKILAGYFRWWPTKTKEERRNK